MPLPSNLTTLDFETEAIVGNPLLDPPIPVGLAVRWPNGEKEYFTNRQEMRNVWHDARSGGPLLFHNAPFDLSVARTHLGMDWPHWSQIHDTMYIVYHEDPYAKSLSLKPSAERYLDIPPTEQDACKAWVMRNVPQAKESDWGAYLCLVPESILAPYAMQDVEDTFLLFQHLYPTTQMEPYDRERELMPRLAAGTIQGVRVATGPLEQALAATQAALQQAEARVLQVLGCGQINLGSPPQLIQALEAAGAVKHWPLTPKGNKSTNKKQIVYHDQDFADLMNYRSTANTMINSFMTNWLEQHRNGRLHPGWNSTRGDRDGGTRTGRLSSSSPNFQNIPNIADIPPIAGLPELPHLRNFILPEEGHLWVKRDFSAQEIRIAAHFEDGPLAEAFRQTPNLDPHDMVRLLVLELTGVDYPRKYIKETGFGILYGMGIKGLSGKLRESSNVARDLMNGYLSAMPGLKKLQNGTKMRGRADKPIKTWGGRIIYKEPPKLVDRQMRSFEYKLLNYLIQGSAADQTKQCIINWNNSLDHGEVFMSTVHDEINISVPEDNTVDAMDWLKTCMNESCEFDVPMLSDGFIGPSWGEVGDD